MRRGVVARLPACSHLPKAHAMKLPDALEQAVRALLAPNGSPRPHGRSALGEAEADRAEPGPASVAVRIEEATTDSAPAHAAAPQPVAGEPKQQEDEAALRGLERAAAVVERLGLGFHLGSAVERIALAADEGAEGAQRLREAAWLIERYLELLERRPVGADLHLAMMRLAREGDAIAGLQALADALERAPAPPAELGPGQSTSEELDDEEPTPNEPVTVVAQPSIARELFLASARAVIVVAAIVGVVLALTLIAQIH
jgi:hypothetical protein